MISANSQYFSKNTSYAAVAWKSIAENWQRNLYHRHCHSAGKRTHRQVQLDSGTNKISAKLNNFFPLIVPKCLGGQSSCQNFPSYCRLEGLFFQLQSPGKSLLGKQQSWFCIRYPSRPHDCFSSPPCWFFLGPMCRNFCSRSESSGPYSVVHLLLYRTCDPVPRTSSHSTGFVASSPPESAWGESRAPSTNFAAASRLHTAAVPYSLSTQKKTSGQRDVFFTRWEKKKQLCFLPGFTKQ